jgi:glucokinase
VTNSTSNNNGPSVEGGDLVVVGDIGGTNARLSLWRCDRARNRHEEVFTRVYPVSSHAKFESAYEAFQREPEVVAAGGNARAAALAVAGAVANNRCQMTNTPWVIDGEALTRELGYR